MLYLMRHGKTDWNDRHKLQGQTDIPLNESGKEMAVIAHEEYRDVHFDVCYSSPLQRAAQTAEILLKGRDVPLIYDERLKEMSFGIYEGWENSFADPDCKINILFQDPAAYTASLGGAETFEGLFARVDSFLNELVLPGVKEGKDILIVAHKALNSAIICRLKGLPLSAFWNSEMGQCRLLRLL